MSSVLVNQIGGVARIVLPSIVTWLVAKKYIPPEVAGPLVDALVVIIIVSASALIDWLSNRGKAVVIQAASEPGVTVEVRPNASQDIRDVSMDPTVKDVLPVK